MINGHEVAFQTESEDTGELPADSRQRSPFHSQRHSLGRGRGLLRKANPTASSTGRMHDGGQTTNQTVGTYSQDRSTVGHSLTNFGVPTSNPSPGQFVSCSSIPRSVSPQQLEEAAISGHHAFATTQGTGAPLPLSTNSADQPSMSRTSGPQVFTSSQVTDRPFHISPLSSNSAYTNQLMSYSPTEFRSSSPYRPEMPGPQSPEREVPTEGLNVIQIKGLPEHATPKGLKALLWESLSTNRTTKVNLEIAQWAAEDTRVYFEDIKGRHELSVMIPKLYKNYPVAIYFSFVLILCTTVILLTLCLLYIRFISLLRT